MTTTFESGLQGDRSQGRFSNLRRWNIGVGLLHTVQAVAIMALANDFSLPVTATFMTEAPGAAPPELTELFSPKFAYGVAAFSLLSALAHFLISMPGAFEWYKEQLRRRRNYARWAEYSLSASLMMVLIAMLTGISDIAALGGIFGVNAAMILFGLLMEKYETPGAPSWISFNFGSIMGIISWVLIGIYIVSPTVDASPPAFVYGIFVSLFVFFNIFAVNMYLQYRQIGPWRDYLFGEKGYIILSLTAKSLLAWQVFSGALAS
ncbi:MAG: heliorhodopsin HeR [Chloroflexi bacterium]|nr:heliorhodopsin HeR [Chloroflexota bacterium]